MTLPVITLIGAGNMGSSLIAGLIKNGHPANKLWAADPHTDKLRFLEQNYAIQTTTDNIKAISHTDVVIFAIKPNTFASVSKSLQAAIQQHHPLVISIAAGIRIASIETWLGDRTAIVRAMPNTPALIGCGATALYANAFVSDKQRHLAESILRAVGIIVWLPNEALLDTVTALSGSGPAYFFDMMEALQLAAEAAGLPHESARLLTLQTALGAAKMAIESGKPLDELRRHVTSPGGTTEKALSVLNEHDLHGLYKKAFEAAKLHSETMAKKLGEEH